MLIAVDARFLFSDEKSDYQNFSQIVFIKLAIQHPGHKFIFFTDTHVEVTTSLPENVSLVVITPKPKNYLTYKWWYDVKMPLAIKKYNAAIFIGSYGLCSNYIAVPQLLIMHDLSFRQRQFKHISHSYLFYKKSTKHHLKKSGAIAVVSKSMQQEIIETYYTEKEKITICGSACYKNYKPLDWNEKQLIKDKYTDGCEYFLFKITDSAASQFITVLKAFSVFKKWQRSNMKLLIIENKLLPEKEKQKLETYRFRKDILLIEPCNEKEETLLTAAAYSGIHPALYEGFSYNILAYMMAAVPVIAYDSVISKEIADDAALYTPRENGHELANQMKVIFKDEALRSDLIEKGNEKAKEYSQEKTTEIIWELVSQLSL